MAEAAIAIAYPEPWNRGKALGYWLTYRLGGQILGGAINLGLNSKRDTAGKVSYTVFLIFIAIQAVGPLVAFFLSKPEQVQRKDGKKVRLSIVENPWFEIRQTTKLFFSENFLLIVLWIGQAVFAEAVYFTYLALWFSVRARALGSFLSGIVAVIIGNVLGVSEPLALVSRLITAHNFSGLARPKESLSPHSRPLVLLDNSRASRRMVALDHHSSNQIPYHKANLRLGLAGFRTRLCCLHILDHRISDQLPLPLLHHHEPRRSRGRSHSLCCASQRNGIRVASHLLWYHVPYFVGGSRSRILQFRALGRSDLSCMARSKAFRGRD